MGAASGGGGGSGGSASCRYSKGQWSECDPKTNMRTRTLTLKKSDKMCEQTKVITKKCKKDKGNIREIACALIFGYHSGLDFSTFGIETNSFRRSISLQLVTHLTTANAFIKSQKNFLHNTAVI
jgi:hypothetical protein